MKTLIFHQATLNSSFPAVLEILEIDSRTKLRKCLLLIRNAFSAEDTSTRVLLKFCRKTFLSFL
jgi:hypothetical protein